MQPPGKRLREALTDAPPPEEDTPARTLPGDIMLEIVSRTDATTVVRSAACCKDLRRDILSPGFLRRACAMPTACLLGFLHAYDKVLPELRPPAFFSLLHPATPDATSLSETRVAPLLSRGAVADLLGRYVPVTSSRGLLLLRRRHIYRRGNTDMCVFNPFTGDRAFFPSPPDLKHRSINRYVMLTAEDGGVGSSFLLLVAKVGTLGTANSIIIQSQTVSSTADDRKWGAVTTVTHPVPPQFCPFLYPCGRAVVLGTLIHWPMYGEKGCLILTHRVDGTAAGWIELPAGALPNSNRFEQFNLHLTSSPDGRLRLLVSDKFTVSMWLLSSTDGAGWEQQAVIDVSPLVPKLIELWPVGERAIKFESAGGRSGAVLLRPFTINYRDASHRNGEDRALLLDMEAKEVRWINRTKYISTTFLYEFDLASQLSAMKSFES